MISWEAFLVAALLVALVPGANQVLGLRNAALLGVRAALVGVLGRLAAFAVLISLAVAGLGAVLARSALAFEVLRWLGVAYLVWLGLTTLLRAGGSEAAEVDDDAPAGAARREFWTALTNPKALLLFVSFVPQFLPAGGGAGALLALSVAYVGVEALAALLYVAGGRALRRGGDLVLPRRRLDQVAGVGFLGFAGYLALARRP